jgi:hypothetical protein
MADQPEALNTSQDQDFVFTGDSDFSAEDRRDVLEAIERVSRENRIIVSPEVFRYRATRQGFVLPLLVNIAAVLALVAGILASSFIGRRDDRRLSEGTGVLRSAEGMVIQQLRRELEDRLREKDQEISQVQQRLESIRSERNQLVSTMDDKIRQKELELRQALEAELAAERARLQAAGETQGRIATLLEKTEQVRAGENQEQLDSFRKQLVAERLALESNLGKLQGEFEGRLNELNRERGSLLSEYRKKEETLRQELEQEKVKLSRQEQQARQELELIKAKEEKQELVQTQILGFYSLVQKAILAGNPGGALTNLEGLERFIDNPELRSMPEIQERLRVDRFLINELAGRIRGEMKQSATQLSELLDSSQLLARLRESAAAAQQLAAAGQQDAARRQYRSAFGLIPELMAGLELTIRMEQEEAAAERRKLEQQLAATPALVPAMIQPQDVPEAAQLLESAQALIQRGEHRAAVEEYLRLLHGYPMSRQAAPALEGVRRAAGLQEARAQEQLQQLRGELEQFDRRQVVLREELERLRPLAERQSSLAAGYAEYVRREGSVGAQAGPTALLQAKQYLDSFLASEPVRQLFPAFLERIHRYDLAFEQEGRAEGREDAVSELIDLVYDLSSYETNQERLRFLQKEIERQQGNRTLRDFLEELSNLLKS